jgi:hypothetical protein
METHLPLDLPTSQLMALAAKAHLAGGQLQH